MNETLRLQSYQPDWPDPAPRFLRPSLPPAPALPLVETFGPIWADWIARAAEAKSAPADYVMAALLAVAGAAIGNSRWAMPWAGWAEPPILWPVAIGQPSSNKSPGLDAVLRPLKRLERKKRNAAEAARKEWSDKAELARIAESSWREEVKKALKAGESPPERPAEADPGPEPFLPRLSVADATVERLGVILARQPRGTLLTRDELAGWLMGMTRYAGGGSDRPFWLEAYGGRGYTVERMGRDPVHIDHLSIGVLGSIQPDRLRSLLLKSEDDGLLARLLPIWPDPAPLRRPERAPDDGFIEEALARLHRLEMGHDESGATCPLLVTFTEEASTRLDQFRQEVRNWEAGSDGLLLSFIGKLPGLAVRLALVLTYLDWGAGDDLEPHVVEESHIARAARFIGEYALPMARRSYAEAAIPKTERAARQLLAILRERGWRRFSSRDALRLDRAGLNTVAELNPALAALEEAEVIRLVEAEVSPTGGRPARLYAVNPAVLAAER